MSIWYFLKLSFLILYTSICAYLAHIMYKYEKDYYEPIYVLKKTGKGKDDEKRVIKKNLKELEMMIKDTQKVSRILAKYDDEVSFMPLLGAVFSTWCDMHEIVLSERWKLLKKLMEVQDTVNMMTDINITNGFPGMEGFYNIEANLVVCDDEEKK